MADAPNPSAPPARPRGPRPLVTLTVLRTQRLSPHLIRVVLGGPGLSRYRHNEFTDRYVKLVFERPGVPFPDPYDPAVVRTLPPEQRPPVRTYTVRSFDADAGELVIDFVFHGDEGVAGPWAEQARPGEIIRALGPGGAYAPDPEADWHLLVGDEAAFPAIASALAAIPDDAAIVAVLETEDAADRGYLDLPDRAEVRWLDRGSGGPTLPEAVRALTFPAGRVHAFVHGELSAIRELRPHLLDERGLDPKSLSLSGYWRRGKDEDGFQAEKREGAEQVTT